MAHWSDNFVKVFAGAGAHIGPEIIERFIARIPLKHLKKLRGVFAMLAHGLISMDPNVRLTTITLFAEAIKKSKKLPDPIRIGVPIFLHALPSGLERMIEAQGTTAEELETTLLEEYEKSPAKKGLENADACCTGAGECDMLHEVGKHCTAAQRQNSATGSIEDMIRRYPNRAVCPICFGEAFRTGTVVVKEATPAEAARVTLLGTIPRSKIPHWIGLWDAIEHYCRFDAAVGTAQVDQIDGRAFAYRQAFRRAAAADAPPSDVIRLLKKTVTYDMARTEPLKYGRDIFGLLTQAYPPKFFPDGLLDVLDGVISLPDIKAWFVAKLENKDDLWDEIKAALGKLGAPLKTLLVTIVVILLALICLFLASAVGYIGGLILSVLYPSSLGILAVLHISLMLLWVFRIGWSTFDGVANSFLAVLNGANPSNEGPLRALIHNATFYARKSGFLPPARLGARPPKKRVRWFNDFGTAVTITTTAAAVFVTLGGFFITGEHLFGRTLLCLLWVVGFLVDFKRRGRAYATYDDNAKWFKMGLGMVFKTLMAGIVIFLVVGVLGFNNVERAFGTWLNLGDRGVTVVEETVGVPTSQPARTQAQAPASSRSKSTSEMTDKELVCSALPTHPVCK